MVVWIKQTNVNEFYSGENSIELNAVETGLNWYLCKIVIGENASNVTETYLIGFAVVHVEHRT